MYQFEPVPDPDNNRRVIRYKGIDLAQQGSLKEGKEGRGVWYNKA